MKVQSVKYNFIMNTILKMSSFLFPLITFPYVSRILGAAGNGKVAFALNFISYFTMIAQLGIPTYGIRACAKVRDNKEELTKTVEELLIISSVMTVIAYILLAVCMFSIPKLAIDQSLIWIMSSSIILTSMGMEWFYQGIEQYGYITYRNLLFKAISLVLMFVFVHEPQDYVIYGAISVIGTVGSNVLNILRIRKYIYLKWMKGLNIYSHIKPILVFFIFSVATTIYTSLDTVMLGFMSTDVQVGYYDAATKIKRLLLSLVTALGTVLLPRASYYIEHHMHKEFKSIIQKSLVFTFLIAMPLMIYFMVEAKDCILFLAGDGFLNSVSSMVIIMPTILFIGLSNLTGMQILIPLNLEKYTVYSTIFGAVVDLIINAAAIPAYGSAGAAFGTLIAEGIVLIVQIYYLKKLHHLDFLHIDWKDFSKILAASAAALLILLTALHLYSFDHLFINLMYSAVIFFGVYGITLIVLKEKFVWQYGMNTILSKIKK